MMMWSALVSQNQEAKTHIFYYGWAPSSHNWEVKGQGVPLQFVQPYDGFLLRRCKSLLVSLFHPVKPNHQLKLDSSGVQLIHHLPCHFNQLLRKIEKHTQQLDHRNGKTLEFYMNPPCEPDEWWPHHVRVKVLGEVVITLANNPLPGIMSKT